MGWYRPKRDIDPVAELAKGEKKVVEIVAVSAPCNLDDGLSAIANGKLVME